MLLHIILTILKILGILILILLALILLTLFSLLFVPVTYRIRGRREKNDEQKEILEGSAVVCWLFGLLRVTAAYREQNTFLTIRILGISVDTFRKAARKIRRIRPFSKKKRQTGTAPAQQTQRSDDAASHSATGIPRRPEKDLRTEDDARKQDEKKDSGAGISSGFVLRFFRKILHSVKKIWLTLKQFCDRIVQWKIFLNDEATREALQCLKENAGVLFRHVLPKSVKGYVRFGFDDPALTGQTLGAVSMILPLYRSKFRIIPVFEEKVLEGDIRIKGRIFGCIILRTAWIIYRSQAVKKTIRKFQHKEA